MLSHNYNPLLRHYLINRNNHITSWLKQRCNRSLSRTAFLPFPRSSHAHCPRGSHMVRPIGRTITDALYKSLGCSIPAFTSSVSACRRAVLHVRFDEVGLCRGTHVPHCCTIPYPFQSLTRGKIEIFR